MKPKTCPFCFAIEHQLDYRTLYGMLGFAEYSLKLKIHDDEKHETTTEAEST